MNISDELLPLLQVTFRDKPLSHYVLNTEAAGHPPQTCSGDHVDVEQCQAASPLEPALTGLYFLSADTYSPHTSCRPPLALNRQQPLKRLLSSVNNSSPAMYVFTPLSTSADYRVKKKLLMNRVVESVSEGFFFFF